MKKTIIKTAAIVLVLALMLSTVAFASVTSSAYISATNAYIIRSGDDVTVYFYIVGRNIMDKIGAKKILLYENNWDNTWTLVKTFDSADSMYTSDLLSTNTTAKSSSVTYTEGSATKNYYALVRFYAEKDGGSDTIPQDTPTSYGTGGTP